MRRAVALGLVMLLPLASAAPAEYEILFSERASEFFAEGTLAEGDSRTFRFVVSQPNVTRIEYELTWTETGDRVKLSGADVLALSVTRPDGSLVRTERADDGEVTVVADRINPLPTGGPTSAAELEERLEEARGEEGMGSWNAAVTVEDVRNPEGASVDDGNDFQLTVRIHFYEGYPLRVVTLSKPTGIAATTSDDVWMWAMAGVGGLAVGLGGYLAWRALVSRRKVTARADVSPEGATRGTSER